jgi:tRNA A-37 threonylcarbamoyl transferase component Bud32
MSISQERISRRGITLESCAVVRRNAAPLARRLTTIYDRPVGTPYDTVVGPAAPAPPPPPEPPPAPREERPPLPDRIDLVHGFQYVHEPLLDDSGPIPFLGERGAIEGLRDRIRNSSGGSFLVTGFRGAGKTTAVLRTLEQVEAMEPDTLDYLPVVLNVARPVSLDELLFEVVRRLFEGLIDRGILDSLSPDVRDALVLSYARTSLAFRETRSETTERGATLGLDGGPMPLGPKLGLSRSRSKSMATEASFLAYSHGDVEHDFLRILDLLNRPQPPPASAWRRFTWRLRGGARGTWQGRVVVVLDELDKLTGDEGQRTVMTLLSGLKNILTTSHVHFIFVGGPELHDASIEDASRGNSVYESVFAYRLYVPCLWLASERLLDSVLAPGSVTSGQREVLRDFLDYKARGIPRLLLQQLNDLVRWDRDGTAYLDIDESAASRISFYARLQEAVNDFVGRPDEEDMFTLAIDRDRWRLGAYYITDSILRRRGAQFALSELLTQSEGSAEEWLRNASPDKVQELIDRLVGHGIVRVAWDPNTGTIIGDARQERTYEVESGVRRKLSSLAKDDARERGDLFAAAPAAPPPPSHAPPPSSHTPPPPQPQPAAPTPWSDTDELGTVRGGRYHLREVIGRGGMGTVYRARDAMLMREVAVKLLEIPHLRDDDTMRARFRREAGIASSLAHPGIVATHDSFEEPDGRMGIVMQLVEGTPLRELLPLAPPRAVEIATHILDALAYLAERGMARVDLKPDNIILGQSGLPVIVDLGLVKPVDSSIREFDTVEGLTVGTPSYMSPEQVRGGPLDIRSDIHALGLVLVEMLTGEQVYRGDSPAEVLYKVVDVDVDTSRLGASEELRQVIARATARNPDDRFASPAEMRDALMATPEARRTLAPG